MSTATLAGHVCTTARAQIPAWGCWWADVSTDDEATLTGSVTLQIADLTLVGKVVSGGPSKGRSHYRICGGAGWGTEIPAKGYANDAGVKLSTVLQDAATACGETLGVVPVALLGPAWARPLGPAGRVLELLAPEAWYVDEAGVTRLGRRAASALAAPAARGPLDLAQGKIVLGADSIASILPGVTVDGLEAVDVLHETTPETGLRSTLWLSQRSGTTRRLSAMRDLLEALDPGRRYRGSTEYRVVSQTGERLDLQPALASSGMPILRRVRVRPGVPGVRADHALGSLVEVRFMNGDPSRPFVGGFSDAEAAGFQPSRIDIGENEATDADHAAGRALRYGDAIMVSSWTGSAVVAGAVSTPLPAALTLIAPPGASVLSKVYP